MSEILLYEKIDAVAVLTINDAPYNRMSLDFMDNLEKVVDELSIDLDPKLDFKDQLEDMPYNTKREIGIDQYSGFPRFTFDFVGFEAGLGILPAIIGLFAFLLTIIHFTIQLINFGIFENGIGYVNQ